MPIGSFNKIPVSVLIYHPYHRVAKSLHRSQAQTEHDLVLLQTLVPAAHISPLPALTGVTLWIRAGDSPSTWWVTRWQGCCCCRRPAYTCPSTEEHSLFNLEGSLISI